MKIRAGKRYVTRDGRVTGPVVRDVQMRLWFGTAPYELGAYAGWANGGLFIGKSTLHPLDLIAEHKDPAP